VVELKRDVVPEVVLNQLYNSRRCRPISAPTWWLDGGRPQVMNLKIADRIYRVP
jgi:DNA gyrase/topoisomerase IV subunit A